MRGALAFVLAAAACGGNKLAVEPQAIGKTVATMVATTVAIRRWERMGIR